MATLYITPNRSGGISLIQIIGDDANGLKLTKAIFEASRTTARDPFDPAVHSRKALADGISGHRAVSVLGECQATALPAQTSYRDAWEFDGAAVTVNMDKARSIHMERIRSARDEELRELDIAMLRALETQNRGGQDDISKRKQYLRDIPQRFDLSKAPDLAALDGSWPRNLVRPV